MKAKTTLLLIIAMFISMHSFAQETYSKVFYHQTDGIQVTALSQSADSNYVMVGFETGSNWEYVTGLIVKFDKQGNFIWSKMVENTSYQQFTDILPTADSGSIVCGSDDGMLILLKIDKNGVVEWARNTVWDANLTMKSICPLNGGGFAIAGYSNSISEPDNKVFVASIDEEGNQVWANYYHSDISNDKAGALVQLPDHTLLVSGSAGTDSFFLLNLLTDGSVNWTKELASTYTEAYDLILKDEGIYAAFAYEYGMGIAKMNFAGNLQWLKKLNLGHSDMYIDLNPQIISAIDGGIVLIDSEFGSGAMLKIEENGSLSWASNLFLDAADIEQVGSNGYLAVGNGPLIGVKKEYIDWPQIGLIRTDLLGNGGECQYQMEVMNLFISLDFTEGNFTAETAGNVSNYVPEIVDLPLLQQEGCVAMIGAINENENPLPLKLLPNPANESFKIEIEKQNLNDFIQLEIRDISGRLVYQSNDQICLSVGINTSQLHPGIYQVILMTKQTRLSGRLAIAR
ncbi:MAG: T9SS type A sorting domain-containing protein [Bacteroidales bacterium]|nr:T9SS type A sorting domain-containing protein [Bacteroidales bacterium]